MPITRRAGLAAGAALLALLWWARRQLAGSDPAARALQVRRAGGVLLGVVALAGGLQRVVVGDPHPAAAAGALADVLDRLGFLTFCFIFSNRPAALAGLVAPPP